MRILLVFVVCLTFSAYIIVSKTNYNNKVAAQTVKTQINDKLSNSNQFYSDTCDLSFLLNTLGKYVNNYEKFELDEERINLIKNELIFLYKDYNSNKGFSSTVSGDELKNKVGCYLNYMVNPKYKPVSFYEFWKDTYFRKFPCN